MLYLNLLGVENLNASEAQIDKDLQRTFQNDDLFQECSSKALSRVLLAFSKYDSTIGYVQGMNFVVGSLLMHCSEEIAFWIFISLIEDFNMRQIFMPELPGLYRHCFLLKNLTKKHLPTLWQHLVSHHMNVEIFAADWIFALFANIIPSTQMHHFYDNFF